MTRTIASLLIALAAFASTASPAFAAPAEDDPGFSCVVDGNRICGPNNDQGVPAGQYNEAGALIPWPHETVPAWCKDICLGA
jgi:hypothetical protein